GAADMGIRPNIGPGYQEIVEHGWHFDSMLNAVSERNIRFLWFAGADPVGDDPTITEVLDALDFLVVQELFLTETARLADVVLPALSFAERDGTYTSGDRRVQRFTRALPPLGQGRADWDILADVAVRLGADWKYDSAASVLAAINQAVPIYAPMTLQALRATASQWPPVGYDSLYFGGTAYQNEGGLGLRWPSAAEAGDARLAFGWVELPTLHDADLIAVPVRWLHRRGTLISHSKILNQRLRGAVAVFNPQDAQRLKLSAGTLTSVSVGGRTFELIARPNPHVPRGVVLVPSNLPLGPLTVQAAAPVTGAPVTG
ncbi:MAG: molybdopterin oxidoreductase family protein, partial [Candidatus Promineifilaceae bacterium]